MDDEKNDLRKNWSLIEAVVSDIWPEEWSQSNPLEIKALEEIIENKKSFSTEIAEVSGGMGCDFSVDLENVYYLLAILWYLQELSGMTNGDIRRKVQSFIETCDKGMQHVYKEVIEPKLDYLISLMKKRR